MYESVNPSAGIQENQPVVSEGMQEGGAPAPGPSLTFDAGQPAENNAGAPAFENPSQAQGVPQQVPPMQAPAQQYPYQQVPEGSQMQPPVQQYPYQQVPEGSQMQPPVQQYPYQQVPEGSQVQAPVQQYPYQQVQGVPQQVFQVQPPVQQYPYQQVQGVPQQVFQVQPPVQQYPYQQVQGAPQQVSPMQAPVRQPYQPDADANAQDVQEPKFDEHKYGQLMEIINGLMNGEPPEMSKVMGLMNDMDTQFWKGSVMGAATAFALTNETVKKAALGAMAKVMNSLGK